MDKEEADYITLVTNLKNMRHQNFLLYTIIIKDAVTYRTALR